MTREGRRYIIKKTQIRESGNLVVCFGEVLSVSGSSTKHGPDKKFLQERVTVLMSERTPELLEELRVQGEKA